MQGMAGWPSIHQTSEKLVPSKYFSLQPPGGSASLDAKDLLFSQMPLSHSTS
jgi:hypothetical protein